MKEKFINFKYLATLLSIFIALTNNARGFSSNDSFKLGHIVQLSPFISHHLIIAEKISHKLHLLEYNGKQGYKIIKSYKMATGKKAGDKIFQGDHRTPEGIYQIVDFIPRTKLLEKYGKDGEIYGVGAFVLNYPNPFDRLKKKSGSGIWIHSTNDETRIEKGLDSRGCLVIGNDDLKDLSQYIEINKTQILVAHSLEFLKEDSYLKQKQSIQGSIEAWLESWRNEDHKSYMSYYSKPFFNDIRRGNYQEFSAYKKAVFLRPGKPQIELSDFTILKFENYAVAIFKQDYKSASINDIGIKTLYLVKDPYYKWKIFKEYWSKFHPDRHLAFKPSQRFFTESEN